MLLSARLMLAVSLLCAASAQYDSAVDALARGRVLKWQMRGKAPFLRESARLGAVRAFRAGAVGVGSRDQRALCALRAGELLRAGGFGEAAIAEFILGAELGLCSWSLRSALAASRMLVAFDRPAEAYHILQCASGGRVPSRFAEAARVLSGVALSRMGRTVAAVETWRQVAEDGVTPCARLDAFERWGQQLLDDGDPEGAAGVLHMCRVKLTAISLEATEQGREVRGLLRSSPLVTAIRSEVRLRREAGESDE